MSDFAVIEPMSCFIARQRMPKPMPAIAIAAQTKPPKPIVPVRERGDCFWTEVVFEALKQHGDSPMPITKIVNQSLKWGKFAGKARVAQKLMMFKIIGNLIRVCRLDRHKRKYVTIPASAERRRAYLEKFAGPLNLPAPQL
jgi:hypothetical protein